MTVKKLLKWLVFLIFLSGGVAIAAVLYLWSSQSTREVPYPYIFEERELEGLDQASQAQILIVGDRMASRLSEYLPLIGKEFNPRLRDPLKVYSWARAGEGFHRTLNKLKNLSSWPEVLLVHGFSQELEEQRFFLQDKKTIVKNFMNYENPWIQSLVIAYPDLSRLLYWPHRLMRIKDFAPYQVEIDDHLHQKRDALTNLILRYEIQELIRLARKNQTTLIFVTTPLNLEVKPKRVCSHAQTTTMGREQRDIEQLLEHGKTKEAFARAETLATQTPMNALNYYLLGKSALELADYSRAQGALQVATMFDCFAWRSTAVTNQLVLQLADQEGLAVIDFDFMVNQNLGRGVLFHDELYAQELYYLEMMKELIALLRQRFRI
jgi:hypothetical protein